MNAKVRKIATDILKSCVQTKGNLVVNPNSEETNYAQLVADYNNSTFYKATREATFKMHQQGNPTDPYSRESLLLGNRYFFFSARARSKDLTQRRPASETACLLTTPSGMAMSRETLFWDNYNKVIGSRWDLGLSL